MLISASRRNMLSFRLVNLECYQITKKSANAKTHSPSRETSALPPGNCAAKGNLIVTDSVVGILDKQAGQCGRKHHGIVAYAFEIFTSHFFACHCCFMHRNCFRKRTGQCYSV